MAKTRLKVEGRRDQRRVTFPLGIPRLRPQKGWTHVPQNWRGRRQRWRWIEWEVLRVRPAAAQFCFWSSNVIILLGNFQRLLSEVWKSDRDVRTQMAHLLSSPLRSPFILSLEMLHLWFNRAFTKSLSLPCVPVDFYQNLQTLWKYVHLSITIYDSYL